MPNPNERKLRSSPKERVLKKYILADSKKHPHRFYPPIRKDTNTFKELMDTRNYFKIMTQIHENLYILIQYYIFCDADIWACGDAVVLNNNPDKKILSQAMCVLTRKQCIAYDEHSHEFLILCPNCRTVQIGVKKTDFQCKECKHLIRHDKIADVPYIKCRCDFCPLEIGWDKVNELSKADKKIYVGFLRLRSHMADKIAKQKISELLEETD